MDLTLVPFGYSESEDRLVDVHQVQSGKLCGCICPSCKAPLIARKGGKKIWHFAHDSSSEVFQKLEKCTYSFFVSARMMARQLIGSNLVVALPDYRIHLNEKDSQSHQAVHVSELVTKSRQVQLIDVVVDAEVNGQRFDILGYVDGHALAFLFSHPGRDGFSHLENYSESKLGIVAIALDGLRDEFRRLQNPNHSYGDILANHITNDTKSKKWIYHPRRQHAGEKAKLKLKIALSEIKKRTNQNRRESRWRSPLKDEILVDLGSVQKEDISDKKFNFICRLCDSSWVGVGNADAMCKKCRNALLVSRIELDC